MIQYTSCFVFGDGRLYVRSWLYTVECCLRLLSDGCNGAAPWSEWQCQALGLVNEDLGANGINPEEKPQVRLRGLEVRQVIVRRHFPSSNLPSDTCYRGQPCKYT